MSDSKSQVYAERILVSSVMGRVRAVAANLRSASSGAEQRSSAAASSVLTDAERPIFDRYTYYGWMYGIPAAGTFFGLAFGGLRFAAYRRWVRAQTLPNSQNYHARMSTSRQQYVALDRTVAVSAKTPPPVVVVPVRSTDSTTSGGMNSPFNATNLEKFSFFADEIVVQVQFMVTVAVSLFVGIMTCNLTYDTHSFHRDLATVPLQPGVSRLCHNMCPAIILQRDKLLAMSSIQFVVEDLEQQQVQLYGTTESSMLKNEESTIGKSTSTPLFYQQMLELNPKELWENPGTEDLESMVILVTNCERRLEFENECRRRNHRVVDSTGLVDIPEPGIPIQYLKSSNSDDLRTIL